MLFQKYIPGEDNPNEVVFHVPIVSAKKLDLADFHPYAYAMIHFQHDNNTCCYSSFLSAVYGAIENIKEYAISLRLGSSLLC